MLNAKRDPLTLLSVSLEAGNKSLTWKVQALHLEVERPLIDRYREFRLRSLYKQTLLLLKFTTQAKILFRFFTKHPKLRFLCPVGFSQIYCLSDIKAVCFGHFFGSPSKDLCAHKLNFSFSPVNLSCVNVMIGPAAETQERSKREPLPSLTAEQAHPVHTHTSIVWSTAVCQTTPFQKAFPS